MDMGTANNVVALTRRVVECECCGELKFRKDIKSCERCEQPTCDDCFDDDVPSTIVDAAPCTNCASSLDRGEAD